MAQTVKVRAVRKVRAEAAALAAAEAEVMGKAMAPTAAIAAPAWNAAAPGTVLLGTTEGTEWYRLPDGRYALVLPIEPNIVTGFDKDGQPRKDKDGVESAHNPAWRFGSGFMVSVKDTERGVTLSIPGVTRVIRTAAKSDAEKAAAALARAEAKVAELRAAVAAAAKVAK